MSGAINPYAAPAAAVADVESHEVQPIKLWSAKGRIGRLRYLAYTTAAGLICNAVSGALVYAVAGVGASTLSLVLVMLVTLIPLLVFHALMGIQRSHDMDWSGWMPLLAIIPLVALLWLFKGGTKGGNRFGAPPPPNSTGVKISAGILVVVMVLGVAALVALQAALGGLGDLHL
ncbi:DUF805 domain-containing protein [Variovorax sp. dw_308]|uniref:DUF805 domain-containing protein n=1 Tax=Variovorax sp. dw_308 TaxID=2721546 RepID=UPI001C44FBD8|nr:DUF805 domain-containing protein [Variovorax sp. dw_308]